MKRLPRIATRVDFAVDGVAAVLWPECVKRPFDFISIDLADCTVMVSWDGEAPSQKGLPDNLYQQMVYYVTMEVDMYQH